MNIEEVKNIASRISMQIFGTHCGLIVERDLVYGSGGRLFLQVFYEAPCTKTKKYDLWKGRKWYLSEFMTDDEIIKTAYAAFEAAVKHEIMEGFKVDGVILFNPHTNFEELLKISNNEVKRKHHAELKR